MPGEDFGNGLLDLIPFEGQCIWNADAVRRSILVPQWREAVNRVVIALRLPTVRTPKRPSEMPSTADTMPRLPRFDQQRSGSGNGVPGSQRVLS
jgi:hypothetical protein